MSEEHLNKAGSPVQDSSEATDGSETAATPVVSAGSDYQVSSVVPAGSELAAEAATNTAYADNPDKDVANSSPNAARDLSLLTAARFGRRFGAWVVDLVLLTLGGMFFSKYLAGYLEFLTPVYNAVSAWAVGFVLSGLILVVPLCLREDNIGQGQSVGKQLFGIEIVSLTGQRVGFLTLVVRELLVKFVLPLFLAWLCLYFQLLSGSQATNVIAFVILVDCLWSLSFAGMALHDIVCRTRVVRHVEKPLSATEV